MEEIRLQMFGSRDLTIWSLALSSDGDSVSTPENLYENSGTPVETCLICTGTPVKTCWKLDSRSYCNPIYSVCGTGIADVLQCVALCCRVLQGVAVCCRSVVQV